MKRLVLALACLLGLATGALAQDDFPSLRQSINYFTNFMQESTSLSIQNLETLEAEKRTAAYPLTDTAVFYADLEQRTQQLMLLTANLMDLYILYNKTTYCYARDEKNYLYGRIDFIQESLQRLLDAPYAVDTASSDGDKARLHDKRAVFDERVRKLREFITSSLPAFKR
jgi:hypothetical protein